MRESDRKRQPCAACGKPVGIATIVISRDGWDHGPEVPLCMKCGTRLELETVWDMIWRRRLAADPEVTVVVRVPHLSERNRA